MRGKHASRGHVPNRVDISERPAIVKRKSRIGDYRGDTVVGLGHTSGLVALVGGRYSKYTLIRRVEDLKSSTECGKIIDAMAPYSGRVHTVTFDNGKEFSEHERISVLFDASIFFARPYRFWERILVEHTNCLVREHFPKGADFHKASDEEVQWVEDYLNSRPHKALGYRHPRWVFHGASVPFLAGSRNAVIRALRPFGSLGDGSAFGGSFAGLRRRILP